MRRRLSTDGRIAVPRPVCPLLASVREIAAALRRGRRRDAEKDGGSLRERAEVDRVFDHPTGADAARRADDERHRAIVEVRRAVARAEADHDVRIEEAPWLRDDVITTRLLPRTRRDRTTDEGGDARIFGESVVAFDRRTRFGP